MNRIENYTTYWESQLRPTPEREDYIKLKLSGLALEAMEEAGQMKLWADEQRPSTLKVNINQVAHLSAGGTK